MTQNEFFDLIGSRHSVRAFKDKEVECQKMNKILDAANIAPSAGNLQGYEIVLVQDKKRRGQLSDAALGQPSVAEAPAVLVFCADSPRSGEKYDERGETLYSTQDATIACAYAQLAASALGLASVWIGAFEDDAVAKVINCPPGIRPVAMLPIGYPNETPKTRPRRKIDELVIRERFD